MTRTRRLPAPPRRFQKLPHIPKGVQVLTLDIETSPIVAYVWRTFKENIGLDQIIEDWSILSFTAKWLHESHCTYRSVEGQENLRDDTLVLLELWKLLDQADIVVTQNGVKFDHRKINARFLCAGMPPPSPFKMVDTMLEARKVAAFTSNRLDWLTRILTTTKKDAHTDFPGFKLWKECLAGNPKAWRAMEKYNPKDVLGTEELYLRLRPWIVGHPNVAVYMDTETLTCPKCGSKNVKLRGFTYTQTGKYQRYRCSDCHGWSRSRYTLNTKATRAALLSN